MFMKFPKLPGFFSSKNSSRTYKIHVKGGMGNIVFRELAKKDFVSMAFLRAGGMMSKRVNKDMLPKKWSVKEGKYLKIISDQVKPYVNDVQKNVRKTHKNFTIYKHELFQLDFEEVGDNYEVVSSVKIWVVV